MPRRSRPSLAPATHTVRVLRLRLKDKHASYLRGLSRDVNLVWNFCQDHALKVLEREHRFCSAYDLHPYTKGAAKEGLSLHSQTIQAIAEEYVLRRRQFKKAKLRWRVSSGPRRSLGWIPFKASALRYKGGQVHLAGVPLSLWDSYGLADYELGAGNISEDARGRWYINITVKVAKAERRPELMNVQASAVGIDLGLRALMTDSDGRSIEAQGFYRGLEPKLAVAQRANKTHRVKALHAKVANRRRDFLHKLSSRQVRQHLAIFVGDVSPTALTGTRMAKSVLDAGWGAYKAMLKYKCDDAGVWFSEVNERYSTQDCCECGSRTGPKGLEGLGTRNWVCPVCNTGHGRDHNAARVIKRRGLEWLSEVFYAAADKAKASGAAVNEGTGLRPVPAPGHGRPTVGIPVL